MWWKLYVINGEVIKLLGTTLGPERPLEIGRDVIPFLDKIFPRQISKLKIGKGIYVTALTHDGNTFMDGILFRLSEECFWFVQPDGDMHTWLLAHKKIIKLKSMSLFQEFYKFRDPIHIRF